MMFQEYSPLIIGMENIPNNIRDITKEKVYSYINSSDNSLHYPKTENVRTTFSKDENFLETANLQELKELITANAITHLFAIGHDIRDFYIVSWLNVFGKNSLEQEHYHFGSLLSGTYYVNSENTNDSGCFSIPDQIPQREQYRIQNKLPIKDHHLITPVSGLLITFEPWIRHGVIANKTDTDRISIAFNIEHY